MATSQITEDAVRMFILDRNIDDNTIDCATFFDSPEIHNAMENAVRHYNEIPPYTSCYTVENLPHSITFLNGIAYYLYLGKLQKLLKEDMPYQAGGTGVDLTARRIAHLKHLIPEFKNEFLSLAQSQKIAANYAGAYGQVG